MPWFWSSEPTPSASPPPKEPLFASNSSNNTTNNTRDVPLPDPKSSASSIVDWQSLITPQTLTATLVLTTTILLSSRLYKSHIRRIPTTAYLKPSHFLPAISPNNASIPARRQAPTPPLAISTSLFGVCTSANDPDNFRFYHTPLGRFAFFSTPLRPIPSTRAALKDQTLSIRLAGIDAPELSHFGKPEQPYAITALEELKSLVEGRRVRVWLLRRDQYNRVVALAFVRRRVWAWAVGVREEGWRRFWQADIGLEMLRRGCATVYEAKYGSEFGGWEREAVYRQAEKEAKRKGLGMWKGTKGDGSGSAGNNIWERVKNWFGWKSKSVVVPFESPREYKQRMLKLEKEAPRSKH